MNHAVIRSWLAAVSLVLILLSATRTSATVTAIGPFSGDFHDNFNEYSNVNAVQSLPVFGNAGVLRNLTSGGAIKVEFSSSLNGDLVTPISGMMVGQLGIGQWEFTQPASKWGG